MILDDIDYINGKINESTSDTAILDNKEDGFTTSAVNRTTKDVIIWKFPHAVLTKVQRDLLLTFDSTYKTTLVFLIVRQDTGESINCRLKKRLSINKELSFPDNFWLDGFEVVEVDLDWQ